MSDKQRQQHLATYWNGPVSRIEAQKVFDETAGVIKAQGEVITKLDMVLAFLVEKSGFTTEEIQVWMYERIKAMQKAAQIQEEATLQPPSKEEQQNATCYLEKVISPTVVLA